MTVHTASLLRNLPSLFAAALLLATAAQAQAPAAASCATPRSAIDSVFAWQQSESTDLAQASRCLNLSHLPAAERALAAQSLKRLFDRRLAYIDMESISDDADYVDADKRHRVVPHEAVSSVVVEKSSSGDWLWTRASLEKAAALAKAEGITTGATLSDKMPASLKGTIFTVALWQYLALLLAVLLGLVVRKLLQFIVLRQVQRTAEALKQQWAARLVDVIASPGATLVMAAMLAVVPPYLELPVRAALALGVAVRLMVVGSIVWASYRLVDVIAARMAQRAEESDTKLDDQLVPLVRKSLKVMTVTVGALFMLQNMNVDVGSLLAGLGLGGLAFALAAKDTLSNFFGSLMIFVDHPFQIGDWVVVAGTEGVVEEVGFRSTRIRTFYNSLVTVPNSKLMEANVDNYGAREYRRTRTTLNVSYATTPEQLQAFCDGIRAILQANPFSRKDYYEVHFTGFGAHSLDIMVYFFFKVPNWSEELRQRHNVYLEILRLAQQLKVEFAYPTQTLQHEFLHAPSEPRPTLQVPSAEALAATAQAFGPQGKQSRPSGPSLTHGYFAGVPMGSSGEDTSEK